MTTDKKIDWNAVVAEEGKELEKALEDRKTRSRAKRAAPKAAPKAEPKKAAPKAAPKAEQKPAPKRAPSKAKITNRQMCNHLYSRKGLLFVKAGGLTIKVSKQNVWSDLRELDQDAACKLKVTDQPDGSFLIN